MHCALWHEVNTPSNECGTLSHAAPVWEPYAVSIPVVRTDTRICGCGFERNEYRLTLNVQHLTVAYSNYLDHHQVAALDLEAGSLSVVGNKTAGPSRDGEGQGHDHIHVMVE